MEQHQRHRLADDIAASQDHGAASIDGNLVVLEQFHDARRSARPRRGPAGHQMADVDGMESVRVFIRRNTFQHPPGVYMLG